jgi:hypothetical protein
MTAQLKIRFDGVAEGMAEHKLELGAFGAALTQLVASLRRMASAMVTEAMEHESGRLKRGAELRVFLDSLSGGCVQLNMDVTTPPIASGYNMELFNDLAARTAEKFVRALEDEGRGVARSVQARKFLSLIPPGVTSQKYEVHSDGKLLYETTLGVFKLADEMVDLPVVIKTDAKIVGIIFEPTLEVRFDAGNGVRFACSASSEMIDKAILLHRERVTIMATLLGSKGRLLWIGIPSSIPAPMTKSARSNHVLSRWQKTLAELAK